MRLLMVLFDKRTIANLLPMGSLDIILAIFTAAGLTKLSPAVCGVLLLHFSEQQKKKHALALLYYGSKFLLQK